MVLLLSRLAAADRRQAPAAWLSIALLGVGLAAGFALSSLLDGFGHPVETADPRTAGLSWAWLAFGFLAQAIFMGRMLVQWIATERARSSVVPTAFWWLSLTGGLMLLSYFARRGDPVGVAGQLFGVVVYARNLLFIYRAPPGEE